MTTGIISDIHLAPGRLNRCSATRGELLSLFDEMEAACDRVVVDGDLFDLSRGPIPFGWRRHLRAIRQEFPAVLARLDAYEWIYGNHDAQLAELGVPASREFEERGLRILVHHGHQFDPPLKKVPGLPRIANFVAGWLTRARLEGAAAALGAVPALVDSVKGGGAGRHEPDRSVRGAFSLVDEGWDIVVQGHSHALRLMPHEQGLFANSGSLCCGHLDWVLIDADRGRVEARRDGEIRDSYVRERGRWRPGVG